MSYNYKNNNNKKNYEENDYYGDCLLQFVTSFNFFTHSTNQLLIFTNGDLDTKHGVQPSFTF